MRAVFIFLVLALLGAGAFLYWTPSETPMSLPERARPLILTTFYPTTYFTQRIVGDYCDVECPVPNDADPIFPKTLNGHV